MIKFPVILIELWEAIGKIITKLTTWITAAVYFVWDILVWLFERFVDVIKYIADKL